jgi:hypothetical protein
MKLIDLEPRWVGITRWDTPDGTQHYHDNPLRRGGISFNCPVHTATCATCGQYLPQTHRLVVFFANPVDGKPPQVTDHLWQRQGETFEDLSLSPSIDASARIEQDGTVCWHGHITSGEIR